MSIKQFAEDHKLRVTKDDCDDLIIRGRIFESNIYEYSEDRLTLGVMFITEADRPRTGLFKKFKAACLDAGMTQVQMGDAEGAFTFDPTNRAQAKVAIKGIRARVKRLLTPEQAQAGAERLAAARAARRAEAAQC